MYSRLRKAAMVGPAWSNGTTDVIAARGTTGTLQLEKLLIASVVGVTGSM